MRITFVECCLWVVLSLLLCSGGMLPVAGDEIKAAAPWPSFRGLHAAGVADGMDLPDQWDASTNAGILFKVAIPGLAHSSPIVWVDRIFLTTTVSRDADASFKPGLYGSGEASTDKSVHEWQILCLDKLSGKVLWKECQEGTSPGQAPH